MRFIIGFVLATIMGIIAYKRKALDKSGVIATSLLGTTIYGFGGIFTASAIVVFFVSSSLLSKVKANYKKRFDKIHDKNDMRDYIQVLANGIVALGFVICYFYLKQPFYLIGAIISIAISNADTWGSEIGVLSKGITISIINFKVIPKGVSGGVSLLGTFASLVGSTFIAGTYGFFHIIYSGFDLHLFLLIVIITGFGFLGSLVDSLLGALFQAQYINNYNEITEQAITNNNQNKLVKGYAWINNDLVNILSNLLTSIVSIVFLSIFYNDIYGLVSIIISYLL